MALDFVIIFSSQNGNLTRHLPMSLVTKASWKRERYGNYADCVISTTIPYTYYLQQNFQAADAVQVRDRIDIFFQGQRRYRGYVSGITRSVEEPYTVTIQGYGLSQSAGKLPVDKRYAFPGNGIDVSTAFGQIVRDFVLPSSSDGGINSVGSLSIVPLGTTINSLDASNSSFSQAANSIVNSSGNLGVWGFDVQEQTVVHTDGSSMTYANDNVFIRPISKNTYPADHNILISDIQTESATAELQIADIYNIVKITGGTAKFPNLLYNGSFEMPVTQQDQAGNWINNGSFEDGPINDSGTRVFEWSTDGQPSIEVSGSNFISGLNAVDGSNMAVMNHAGDHIYQMRNGLNFTPGDPYLFSFYAARTSTNNDVNSHCLFEILDASNNVLLTETIPITNPSSTYDYYQYPFVMPENATGFYVYYDGPDSDSSTSIGLCVDEVNLYDTKLVYQDNWVTEFNGTVELSAIDWVHSGTLGIDSFDGAYSVLMSPVMATSSGDSNNIGLLPPRQNPVSCQSGRDYLMSARVKLLSSAPGATIQAKICYYWWGSNSNDSFGEQVGPPTELVLDQWVYIYWTTQNQEGDAVTDIRPVVRVYGGNCTVLVDAVMMQDEGVVNSSQFPSGGSNPYVDSGNLTYTIRADDPMISTLQYGGLPVPYSNSIVEYGLLYTTLSESSVLTVPEAYAYADAYFQGNATPYTRPTIVRVNDPVIYNIGETAQLQGIYASSLQAPVLPIIRIQETYDGLLKTTLELEVEQPDLSLILRKLVLENQGLYGTDGNPGGTGGAGDSGGSNVNPTGVPSTPSDHKVCLNTSDSDPDYLDAKIGVDGVSPLQVSDVGNTRTFSIPAATDSTAGYLTAADHASLTYDSAQIPLKFTTSTTLGGDLQGVLPDPTLVAKGPGAGTYGSSTQYPIIQLDSNGRVVAVTLQTISVTGTGGGTVTGVTASTPLTSSGGTAPNISLSGTIPVSNGGTGQTSLTGNALLVGEGTSAIGLTPAASTGYLYFNGTSFLWQTPAVGGGGTVTSVGISVPSIFSVSGSPVTSSGTIAVALSAQTPNTLFVGPASGGSAAAPTFRSLVAADLPTAGTVGAGTYGSTTQYPIVQVDAYGRVVGITLVTPAYPVSSVAGRTGAVVLSTTDISGLGSAATQSSSAFQAAGASAGGDLQGTYPNPTLIGKGPGSGTYGSSTQYPIVTLDANGRVTAITLQTVPTGSSGTLSSSVPNTETVGSTGSAGSTGLYSDAGHIHPMPAVFLASGSGHTAGFVPDPGATAGTTRFLREDSTWVAPTVKRKLSIYFAPNSTSATTGADLTQIRNLPATTTSWTLVKASMHVDSPSTSGTTFQIYSAASGSAFGSGTSVLSAALGGTSGTTTDYSTTSFAATTLASEAMVAPSYPTLNGSNVSCKLEIIET